MQLHKVQVTEWLRILACQPSSVNPGPSRLSPWWSIWIKWIHWNCRLWASCTTKGMCSQHLEKYQTQDTLIGSNFADWQCPSCCVPRLLCPVFPGAVGRVTCGAHRKLIRWRREENPRLISPSSGRRTPVTEADNEEFQFSGAQLKTLTLKSFTYQAGDT